MVNVTYTPDNNMVVTDESGVATTYNLGDTAWIIVATALVWLMIPGVGFFYSGLLRRKNALSMIWASMMCLAVVSFEVRSFALCAHLPPTLTCTPVVLLGLLSLVQ